MTEQDIQERLKRRIEEKFPQGEGVAESIDDRVNQLMTGFCLPFDGGEG